ncbi:receptor-like protein kinase FERONIA [Cornus florida]|uniref:receptor-like protein kinase FERONIA n=1 Tax=Cornus florida TaxID=4283 RepID=UPI00289631FC|nr:receptor-like protein kinase FERONIA [Cornus florida]
MYHSYLRIISTVYVVHHLLFTGAGDWPVSVQYYPTDDIAINCGSTGNLSAFDGREWIGDMGSKFISQEEAKGKSVSSSTTVHQSLFADPVPYMTARISRAQFKYTFQLSPGQKFIRLHFFPALYSGFERSKALFTVKAGPYTLLSNFSASLTADVLGVRHFAKEFCVNIEKNEVFSIVFSPSKSSASDDVYAFVNGIEIVSMPAGLYYTLDGDFGPHVVGNKFFPYSIDNGTALETVYRLNVGGRSILPVEDLGMFRMWFDDKNYLLQSSLLRVSTRNMITYTNIPTYAAPNKVYQTTWSIISNQPTNQVYNLSWKLPIDLGFRYLVRLHFCELEPMITSSEKQFDLMINNKIVETDANVIKWSGGNGVAVYKDYVATMEGDRMEGRRDLIIALLLKYESNTRNIDAILKGVEVFKLSNLDNNLAGVNPVFTSHVPKSGTPTLRKIVLAFGSINSTATAIILALTLLNFIVYHLNRLESNSSKINILSSLDEEELHRRFSVVEILLATNNFDVERVIGRGGFGNVYKGFIDRTRCVAIKRLNSQSKQGAQEFWAEIDTLSKLRHDHLVPLIGYCDDCQEMILVYEYMANGTLADHLHKGSRNGRDNSTLSWEQRLNICIGAARGLDFLHTGRGAHKGIIHRDVKSSNILLDENWVAKISDFGLSKMDTGTVSRTHISTNVKGTFGYLDPEYFMAQRLSKKSDVYAFGVVLFEALCGRKAVDLTLEEEQHSLSVWVRQCIRKGTIDLLVDPSVMEQISPHCLRRFVEIANKCLHDQPNERPTMAEIVVRLHSIILELQGRADSCTEQEVIDVGRASDERVESSITLELQGRADSYTEQEVIDAGRASNEHVELSITSEDSPHVVVKNGSRVLESISPGTKKNMKVGKKKDFAFNHRWWLGSLWPFHRSSKTKAYPPLEVYCGVFSLKEIGVFKVPFAEIGYATNNFSTKVMIGENRYGKIYKGTLRNGMKVAVIRSLRGHPQGFSEFQTEIMVSSKVRHCHLVSLIGYCDEGSEMILVYEFMEKGSLRDHLYNNINDDLGSELPWIRRLEICIGAAKGLDYLHTGAEGAIIHGDVKSTNILLDEDYVAKVADFSLSRYAPLDQTHVSTIVKGAFGYLDPEYYISQQLTPKSDVYSFGVVLLEVLCARPAINNSLTRDQVNLAQWGMSWQMKGQLEKIIDPKLVGKINPNSLKKFGETAEKCLKDYGAYRPTMDVVLWDLEYALQLQQTATFGEPHEDSTIDDASGVLPFPLFQRFPSQSSITSEESTNGSEVFSQLNIDDDAK